MIGKIRGNFKKLWEIAYAASILGITSFGGPTAHFGYFYSEYVSKRKWISAELYAEIVALCQVLPGPGSSQVGIAVGTYHGRILGGILAWAGFTFPSVIILVAAYYGLKDLSPADIFWLHGLKVSAASVVAHAVWNMGKRFASEPKRMLIAVTAAFALHFYTISYLQILVLILTAFIGVVFLNNDFLVVKQEHQNKEEPFAVKPYAGIVLLCVLAFMLLALPFIQEMLQIKWLELFERFFRVGALVFGGGHVVLPLLEKEVVSTGWVTKEQFLIGYGLAQAVPGPLFTFAAYLGAVIAGWKGALIATVAIFLPSFFLVFGALPFLNQVRSNRQFQAALEGINAAVVGMLLAAFYDPVWINSVYTVTDFFIVVVSFGMLQYGRVPPWIIVVFSCLAVYLI